MDYQDFYTVGLNENEAKIYIAILELGEAVVSRIANKSGIKRTTAYLSLHNLKSKGLIGQAKKGGQMRYFAEDPKILDRLMKNNNEKFSKLMPEISAVIKLMDHKPTIQYYEGNNAYKKIYDNILTQKKQEILSWQPNDTTLVGNKYFIEHFNPQRLFNKIAMKTIISGSHQGLKKFPDLQKLNQTKFTTKEIYLNKTEIYIYDKNKVGIISVDEDISIIIESKNIHETVKGIFNLLWHKL